MDRRPIPRFLRDESLFGFVVGVCERCGWRAGRRRARVRLRSGASGAFKRDSLPHRNRFVSGHGFSRAVRRRPHPIRHSVVACPPEGGRPGFFPPHALLLLHPKIFLGTCAGLTRRMRGLSRGMRESRRRTAAPSRVSCGMNPSSLFRGSEL